MKHSGQCHKCKSTEIIADVKVVDRGDHNAGHHMILAAFTDPDAFVFKGEVRTTVSAWVCAGCGFVEFYAHSPDLLKQARDEAKASQT
jgi:predicted nucleic-acid-binding Zn-ribbon protein